MSDLYWLEHRKGAKLMKKGRHVPGYGNLQATCLAEVQRIRTYEGTTEWKSVINRPKGIPPRMYVSQTFRKKRDAMAVTVVSIAMEDYNGYK